MPFHLVILFRRIYPKKIVMEFSHYFGPQALSATIFRIVENVKNLNVQHDWRTANERNKHDKFWRKAKSIPWALEIEMPHPSRNRQYTDISTCLSINRHQRWYCRKLIHSHHMHTNISEPRYIKLLKIVLFGPWSFSSLCLPIFYKFTIRNVFIIFTSIHKRKITLVF